MSILEEWLWESVFKKLFKNDEEKFNKISTVNWIDVLEHISHFFNSSSVVFSLEIPGNLQKMALNIEKLKKPINEKDYLILKIKAIFLFSQPVPK